MEGDHGVENVREDSLLENVWFEGPLCRFHTKGHVVPASNVFAVIQASSGAVAAIPDLKSIIYG